MKHIVHVMPANISHNSYTTKDDYRPESMIRLMDDNGNLTDKAVLAYGVKFKGEVELKSGYGNDVLPETQTRVWLEGEIESVTIRGRDDSEYKTMPLSEAIMVLRDQPVTKNWSGAVSPARRL